MIELKERPPVKTGSSEHSARSVFGIVLRGLAFAGGALACLIVALVVVELMFAAARVGEGTFARPDPLRGYAHLENQSGIYRDEGYSQFHINSRGFKDRMCAVPKPAGVQRICFVGDSMCLAIEVPPACAFPKLLEKRLQSEGRKVEVLNCGMSGTGTGQQYLGIRQSVLPLQPDMLIIAYHQGDTDDNVGGGTTPPRPTFTLTNNKLQVDYKDVDKWLSSNDARFYTSLDWLRRNCRILAVLNKLDTDLQSDPTYKTINKVIGKPVSVVWQGCLRLLPRGNWHIAESRQVAADLMPSPATSVAAQAVVPAAITPVALPLVSQAKPVPTPAPLTPPVSAATPTPTTHPVLAAAPPPPTPENGDLIAYRGMLGIHYGRMAVTKEIIRRINNECRERNCRLVIAALPAYDNSIMYYRELNELQQFAAQEGFGFVNSCPDFPARGPMEDSPFHFGVHFNRAGHIKMCDVIYRAFFAQTNSGTK